MRVSLISLFSLISLISLVSVLPLRAFAYRIGDTDVHVRAGTNIRYDDNLTYIPDNPLDDIVTNVSVGVRALYEGKNTAVDAGVNVDRDFFSDHKDFDNTSEDFSLRAAQELSKYDRLLFTERFDHSEEPRSWEDAFGRTGGRYSYYRNLASLAYSRDITAQLAFTGRYSNQQDYYTRKASPDSHLDSIGLETTYFISSADGILLSYNFYRREFRDGPAAAINNLMSGLKHYFTEQLYFDGLAGLDFIEPYSGARHTKPVFSASLTDEFDKNSRLAVTFAKQYQAVPYTAELFNSWRTSCDLSRRILERLGGSLSVFYGEGEYVPSRIKDDFTGVSAGLTYDIQDTWQAKLTYTHSETASSIHSREYTKNTVSFGMTGRF